MRILPFAAAQRRRKRVPAVSVLVSGRCLTALSGLGPNVR